MFHSKTMMIRTISILLLIFIIFLFDNAMIKDQVMNNIKARIAEISSSNRYNFESMIDFQMNKIESLATYFGQDNELDHQQQLQLLHVLANDVECNNAIIFKDGSYISHDLNPSNTVLEEPFFKQTMDGKTYVGKLLEDKEMKHLIFSVPIIKDGEVYACLYYNYPIEYFENILNFPILDGLGKMMITSSTGDILIGEMNGYQNVFDYIESIEPVLPYNKELYQSDILNIEAKDKKESLLVEFDQLNRNDWYAVTLVSKESAIKTVSNITTLQQSIAIAGGTIIFALVIGNMWIVIKKRKAVDHLTGSLSFLSFKEVASELIQTHPDQEYSIVKFDIRNFKLVNRANGFDKGDQVIKNMGRALEHGLSMYHSLYSRIAVDQFIFIVPYKGTNAIETIREQIITHFYQLMGKEFLDKLTFPTGIYVVTKEDHLHLNLDDIYEKVNFAHTYAKQSDYQVIIEYEDSMEQEAMLKKHIEDRMENALEKHEFRLFLQPKFDTKTSQLTGAEALVRWRVEGQIIAYPGHFVSLFEKNGFITSVDFYMFEQAAIFLKKMMDNGYQPIPISVNFSRLHLYSESFIEDLCTIADKYHIPHHYLEIELTESVVFNNEDIMIELLKNLHARGFALAMDDFGSGYSSLALLKNLEVDVLKIDGAFFDHSNTKGRGNIVISNIMRLAKELSITTVAEGIETKEEVDMLKEYGCDMIQGFYFSKPIEVHQFYHTYQPSFHNIDKTK